MDEIKLEQIFNALSDTNRLKILSIIKASDEVCGCEILEKLSITQPTLAYHMKILQDVKLVSCYKRGTWCVYKIESKSLLKIEEFINDISKEKK